MKDAKPNKVGYIVEKTFGLPTVINVCDTCCNIIDHRTKAKKFATLIRRYQDMSNGIKNSPQGLQLKAKIIHTWDSEILAETQKIRWAKDIVLKEHESWREGEEDQKCGACKYCCCLLL